MEKLTACEELVMKTVWDAGEELSLTEIMQRTNEKYHKEWKPQTVSTFLGRLVRKGYLRHYRQGRVFFYQILIPLEEYKGQQAQEFVEFWHHNNADDFLRSLMEVRTLRRNEVKSIGKLVTKREIKEDEKV